MASRQFLLFVRCTERARRARVDAFDEAHAAQRDERERVQSPGSTHEHEHECLRDDSEHLAMLPNLILILISVASRATRALTSDGVGVGERERDDGPQRAEHGVSVPRRTRSGSRPTRAASSPRRSYASRCSSLLSISSNAQRRLSDDVIRSSEMTSRLAPRTRWSARRTRARPSATGCSRDARRATPS